MTVWLWILSNKRWCLIAVLGVFYVIQLGITNHYVKKLNKSVENCTLEKQAITDAYKQASDKANADLLAMSEKYEAERLKEKVIYNEEKTQVREIIKNNPVYIECKLDSGMYDKLREATTTK